MILTQFKLVRHLTHLLNLKTIIVIASCLHLFVFHAIFELRPLLPVLRESYLDMIRILRRHLPELAPRKERVLSKLSCRLTASGSAAGGGAGGGGGGGGGGAAGF